MRSYNQAAFASVLVAWLVSNIIFNILYLIIYDKLIAFWVITPGIVSFAFSIIANTLLIQESVAWSKKSTLIERIYFSNGIFIFASIFSIVSVIIFTIPLGLIMIHIFWERTFNVLIFTEAAINGFVYGLAFYIIPITKWFANRAGEI